MAFPGNAGGRVCGWRAASLKGSHEPLESEVALINNLTAVTGAADDQDLGDAGPGLSPPPPVVLYPQRL